MSRKSILILKKLKRKPVIEHVVDISIYGIMMMSLLVMIDLEVR